MDCTAEEGAVAGQGRVEHTPPPSPNWPHLQHGRDEAAHGVVRVRQRAEEVREERAAEAVCDSASRGRARASGSGGHLQHEGHRTGRNARDGRAAVRRRVPDEAVLVEERERKAEPAPLQHDGPSAVAAATGTAAATPVVRVQQQLHLTGCKMERRQGAITAAQRLYLQGRRLVNGVAADTTEVQSHSHPAL